MNVAKHLRMQHVIDVAKLGILHLSGGVKSCSVVDVGKKAM